MFSKINFEVLIQIIIEVFMALALMMGLATGKINLLVHPKFNIFLGLSALLLIAMAFVSSFNLFKARHMNIFTKYFLLMIPLLFCMVISMKSLTSGGAYSTGVGGVANGVSDSKNLSSNSAPASSLNLQSFNDNEERTRYKKNPGEDFIDINDAKYLKWYYDMTYKWNDFEGEKFKFLATVFKPDNGDNFVVLGRLGMVCCMADMQPCGFIYNGKGYKDMHSGEWYWVTAKIKENKKFTYNYEKLPMAYDISIEKARKPTDEYVYIQ